MRDERYGDIQQGVDVCPIWHEAGTTQMRKLVAQCEWTSGALDRIADTQQSNAIKAGFAAEALHAETFNLDAILKDSNTRAYTDSCANTPLQRNHAAHDIVVVKDGKVVHQAQLKYYQNAEKTANALRETRGGVAAYKDADLHVAPSDQVDQIRILSQKTEQKNGTRRPEVADAARDVRDKVADRLEHEGAQSRPLSKKEAEVIAKGDDQGKGAHRKIQTEVKNSSTRQQSMNAAKSAAIVSTILAGTINTISCLNKVQRGEISGKEALLYIVKNTAIAAGDSALKAAAATAATSLSANAFPQFFQTSTLQSSFVGATVAGASICAVDLIECLVLVAAKRMTFTELETRTGKNVFQTASASVGASIGAALGTPAGPAGMLVGSLIGGMISSVATTIAIENHIEKPFRETMLITSNLVRTGHVMKNSIYYLHQSQVFYAELQSELRISEQQFERQTDVMDQLGTLMTEKINQI